MKRFLLPVLAVVLILSAFSGCARYTGSVSCILHVYTDDPAVESCTVIDFTEEAMQRIRSVLNRGKWSDSTEAIPYDVELTLNGGGSHAAVFYNTETGVFFDATHQRTMTLSEQEREDFNCLFNTAAKSDRPD